MPWAFSMLKTENNDAATINSVDSTKCLPGQIRFPNPNVDANTGSSRKLPPALRNRSGLKASGSGYMIGSCKMALKIVEVNSSSVIRQISYHAFPTTSAPENRLAISERDLYVTAPTFRYKETIVDVIFCGRMGNGCGPLSLFSKRSTAWYELTKGHDGSPPHHFPAYCIDERQPWAILESRKPLSPSDSIYVLLRSLLYFRMKQGRYEKRHQGRYCLKSESLIEMACSHISVRPRTVSVPPR
jgi:hypothetical protein